MSFQLKILLLSYLTSAVLSVIILPLLKKLKIRQIERTTGPKSHLKKNGTPTMGGLIIILSTIALSIFLYFNYSQDEPEIATRLLPMLFVTTGFGVIGFIDDFKKVVLHDPEGISPYAKMSGLSIITIIYIMMLVFVFNNGTEIYIPFANVYWTMPKILYFVLALLVFLGTTNAINLTDGIDGLAGSVTTLITTALTVISIIWNIKEMTIFGSIIIGSSLGFLLLNIHPAHVYMGDTGSLLLGGAIAGIALYMKIPLLLLILAIIPVVETISVILQLLSFKIRKKKLFLMAPIHHHYELKGWNEPKIVIIFSIITIIGCAIGILSVLD